MIGSATKIFLVVNYILSVALAAYRPVSPLQGSYTWEIVISDKTGPLVYTGGRTIYDYVSGYVRMESWNTTDPTPGINGVTLWDLREATPIVTTIDSNAVCFVQKLTDNNTAPMPPDWSAYSLAQVTYFNRALAEEWTDGYGGVVYVDVFSRDVVGMGNYSTSDDGDSIFYNIQSWSDNKPDGTLFLLPNTIPCKPIALMPEFTEAARKFHTDSAKFGLPNFKCIACKLGIGLVIGRLCNGAGALACAPFPPAIPFCAVLAALACKVGVGKISKDKACKIIHAC
jgi:hypothetical protein